MKSMSKRLLAASLSFTIAAAPFFSANPAGAADRPVKMTDAKPANAFLDSYTTKDDKKYSDDTLVIKYAGSPLKAADHKKAGTTVIQEMKSFGYTVVKVNKKKKTEAALSYYKNNKNVLSAYASPVYKTFGTPDPKVSQQSQLSMLQIEKAQKLAGKSKVTVAVIDQGVDRDHPELKGSLMPSYNAANPMNPAQADFHGTHVAGIIGAKKNNGAGGYGINPNVNLLSVDVFDRSMNTYDYLIAKGIEESIKKGAKVINLSLGSYFPSELLEAAVNKAISKGIVIVAAAGNEGSDVKNYPAAYEGVISVSSVDKSKKLSSFSSYGSSIDLAAPGEGIYAPYYDYEKKSTYTTLSGTSMASPMVAGAASLLLSKHPKRTPAQVEYILKETASDLGPSGYDVKFGNGLVNPAAALKYDIKKLPSFVKKTWSTEEIMKKAVKKNADKPVTVKGSITKAYQQNWIKFDVKKGDHIQTSLASHSPYDYKMTVLFNNGKKKKTIEINNHEEGGTEAELVKAPFDGTVAIGVKDVNGGYDDKQSVYELKAVKYKAGTLPADESSMEAPAEVGKLPYTSGKTPLYLLGEDGDDDVFRVKTDDARMVKVHVTGVPGVDLGINVYTDEPSPSPEEQGTDEGTQPSAASVEETDEDEYEEGEDGEFREPIVSRDNGGKGKGETLYFTSEPGKEYFVEVTNRNLFFFDEEDFDFDFEDLFSGIETGFTMPSPSMLPYKISMNSKLMPEDEDGISDMDDDWSADILDELALKHKAGTQTAGYLQSSDDQDWFKLSGFESGIYQFDVNTKNAPVFTIYEEVEESSEEGLGDESYLKEIGSNYDYYTGGMTKQFFAGLKKGSKYYIQAADFGESSPGYEQYAISSKLAFKNAGDKYENNDTAEKAKKFPASGTAEGNIGAMDDEDYFYFAPGKTAIYGVKMERKVLTSAMKAKYPKELLSEYYIGAAVIEDTNGNHMLDRNEMEKAVYFQNVQEDGLNTGSFKGVKGKKYFVSIFSYVNSSAGITLWPYQVTMKEISTKDEDAGSKVKNNTPSKPLKLKKVKSKTYSATASLNRGTSDGDEDWFVFKADKAAKAVITLSGGRELDGAFTVYKDGKRVGGSDAYLAGDSEIKQLNLKKGTYYIKVRDSKGNATFNPYTISVKLK